MNNYIVINNNNKYKFVEAYWSLSKPGCLRYFKVDNNLLRNLLRKGVSYLDLGSYDFRNMRI
jgi:hypothetical protein